jgi:hypothetical protein
MRERNDKCIKILVKKLEGRRPLEELDVEGKIKL